MGRKLKIFRTAIGFHDAYVAAPSQKAALEAWGADANLFARGAAEVVTDSALSQEALAHPGRVIKRLRGTEAEHLAALEQSDGDKMPARPTERSDKAGTMPKPKPKPRPSRRPFDNAYDTLVAAEAEADRVSRSFRERERQLAQERRVAEQTAENLVQRARSVRDAEKARYERALARWRR